MKATATVLALSALMISLTLGAGCGSARKVSKGADGTGGRGDGVGVTDRAADTLAPYSLSDIHFDFDRHDLRSQEREMLTRHSEWLSKNSSVRVLIEGHCDERGTVEYNLALGEARARAAKYFFQSYGVPASRLEIVSYGKERPLDPGHDESAWATNRRDSFVRR